MPHKKVRPQSAKEPKVSSAGAKKAAKRAKKRYREARPNVHDGDDGLDETAATKASSSKVLRAPTGKRRSAAKAGAKRRKAGSTVVKSIVKKNRPKVKKAAKVKIGKHAKASLTLPGVQCKQQTRGTRTTTAGSPSKGSASMNPARQNSKGSKNASQSTNPRSNKAPWHLKKKTADKKDKSGKAAAPATSKKVRNDYSSKYIAGRSLSAISNLRPQKEAHKFSDGSVELVPGSIVYVSSDLIGQNLYVDLAVKKKEKKDKKEKKKKVRGCKKEVVARKPKHPGVVKKRTNLSPPRVRLSPNPSPRVRDPQVEQGHMIHELMRVKSPFSNADLRSDDNICVARLDPALNFNISDQQNKKNRLDVKDETIFSVTSESTTRRRLVAIKPSLAKNKNSSMSGGISPARVVNLDDLKHFTEKYPSPLHDERDVARTLVRMSSDDKFLTK